MPVEIHTFLHPVTAPAYEPGFFMIFLEYVRALAWPLVILWIVFSFRENIGDFLRRLTSFRSPIGDFTAEAVKLETQQQETTQETADTPPEFAPAALDEKRKEIEEALQQERKGREELEESINKLIGDLSAKELELDFERVMRVIFGSQLQLLDLLNQSFEGIPKSEVETFFQDVKAKSSALQTWDTGKYLSLLFAFGLISEKNEKVVLTPTGQAFLVYITQRGYSKKKPL